MRYRLSYLGACLTIVLFALAAGPTVHAQDAVEDTPLDQAIGLLNSGQIDSPEFEVLYAIVRQQAENGDPLSMNFMGVIRANSIRTDGPAAREWYRRAVAADHELATAIAALNLYLILLYDEEPGASDNARGLLEGVYRGPDGIMPHINGYLGTDYIFGYTGPRQEAEGVALLEGSIGAGFDDAVSLFAYSRYLQANDPERAFAVLGIVAQQNTLPEATWSYAQALLERGDEEDAFSYVVAASDQGYELAHISRAVMLATGQGTPMDQRQAREWYVNAMRQGSAHAARGLGAMLIIGEGGEPDLPLGFGLLELADAAGDELAANVLRYASQQGIERPDNEAINARVDDIMAFVEQDRSDFR